MKIFFIIKEKSQRVKNKNFLKIDNVPLYKFVLRKFKNFQVFVDTDSKKIIDSCKKDPLLNHVLPNNVCAILKLINQCGHDKKQVGLCAVSNK